MSKKKSTNIIILINLMLFGSRFIYLFGMFNECSSFCMDFFLIWQCRINIGAILVCVLPLCVSAKRSVHYFWETFSKTSGFSKSLYQLSLQMAASTQEEFPVRRISQKKNFPGTVIKFLSQ